MAPRNPCRARPPFAALVLLLLQACLNVAEPRAERDTRIGHAELERTQLDVTDGLAAIRRFEPGQVELWANAPALHVRLVLADSANDEWSLTIRNTLPDAVLSATSNGQPFALSSAGEAVFSTERRVHFSAPGGSSLDFTLSAPDAATAAPFEFIDFADVQEAVDVVSDVFDAMNQESAARFVTMAGDITRSGSSEQLERFQSEQQRLHLPIFVTLGNHELGDSDVPYHDFFGRGSYSFVFRGARFTFLDSASATLDPSVYGWLDEWLEAGRNQPHLTFMHVPPLDPSGIRNGAFSSRAEADKLLARLGRGRVATTFYGHIHSYYAFENAGIPAFISGGGGAIPERFDNIGRHFLVVRVDPEAHAVTSRIVRVD
ncbi:MAG TPA: metallophosphoesterase [Polyangiaceae bacterium]|nr:metallophosphoesterase [Polyangiaceae bacterium]